MNYTSKRKYAGCYAINAEGIALDLEESNQSCCGKSVPPLWMLYFDGCIDIGEFESKRNASGGFSYSAPDGMHDDCVMSLAIAWHGATGGGTILWMD